MARKCFSLSGKLNNLHKKIFLGFIGYYSLFVFFPNLFLFSKFLNFPARYYYNYTIELSL